MIFFKFICLFFLISSCNQLNQEKKSVKVDKNEISYSFPKIIIKIFRNFDNIKGWGYDIYVNDTLYIHQPHIPAINGIKGFSSEHQALEVGNFVIMKIKNKIMPPTVNVSDLDSMQITH